MDRWVVLGAVFVAACVLSGCSDAPVEGGLFFPTWSAEGAVPSGIVQGTLVKEDGCLYVEADDQPTLVVWEDGMGFEDGTLLDTSGSRVARVGAVIHGGGGYFSDLGHIEDLSGEPIPERCIPDGGTGDRFAVIYEVATGPFE